MKALQRGLVQSGDRRSKGGHRVRPKQQWTFTATPSGDVIKVQARTVGEAAQLARAKLAAKDIAVTKLHIHEPPGGYDW